MINRRKCGGDGPTEEVRPTFSWYGKGQNGNTDIQTATGQLTEDIRDVLEQIRDSQMLQCDVRADIRRMRMALEKIARNTPVRRKKRVK